MILVPQIFWETLLNRFQRDRTNLERVAYLDGVRSGALGIVTTITVPRAQRRPQYFRVTAANMSAAGKHLLRYGLQRLAQVHTHGGRFTEHSDVDDVWAYSQRPGALSIVVPWHGRGVTSLIQCGVHLRREAGWALLSKAELPDEITIFPSSVILG
jgi:hypothetical protein